MSDKEQRLSVFPVFLKVEDRLAVVFGDGAAALAKARLLHESRIRIRLASASPSVELAAFAIQADAELDMREFAPELLEGASLAFAATGDPEKDALIAAEARRQGILVNAVDQPNLCDFFTPSLVNRAPVAVAIGSEGTGPVLTQLLRARIEALLPPSLGRLARLAGQFRPAVEKSVGRGARRRDFWRRFFTGEPALAMESGGMPAARRAAASLLTSEIPSSRGSVAILGFGGGDPELLTLKAQRLLMNADIIAHDGTAEETVLALGRRDALRRVLAAGKDWREELLAEALAGHNVVRIIAGDPRNAAAELAFYRSRGVEALIAPAAQQNALTDSGELAA